MTNHLNLIKFYVSLIDSKVFNRRGAQDMMLLTRQGQELRNNSNDLGGDSRGYDAVSHMMSVHPKVRAARANVKQMVSAIGGINNLTSDTAIDFTP